MKFFLLDKQQNIIGRLSEEYILEATFTEEINTAGELLITLPAKKRLSGNVIHVLITNPSKDHSYLMFKIIKETVKDEEVEYTAVESAYDELTSYGYIQDKRPTANAQTITEMILKDTRWHVGEIPDTSETFISFYYLSVLDCLKKIVQTFDFEIGFDVLINDDENQITDRRVNFYIKQGEQTGKRFEYGSNLLSIKQEQDTQNIYTALVGRGKGVQVSGGDDDNTPGGYGRRITFADVEWSKANGDPLDKPKGQEWLEDPDATKQLGFSDGHMRIGLEVFEDVDDPKTLLQKTYEALKTAERPQVQFSASVINTGELHLGDRVGITRNDIGIAYETRVFKVQHNLLDETQNKIDLGDNLEQTNNLSYQVSALQSEVTNNTEGIITVTQSANGKNKVYYSSTMPATGSNGDVWYKDLGNGETEMYIYDNGWQLVISTENLHKIEDEIKQQQTALDQAVQDANAASAKADGLVAQVGDANTNAQKALTTAQQNQADLAQAKNDLENTKNQLTNVQSDLTGTKSSLAGAISNISQAQEDLKNTEQSLQGVKSSLANDEKNLSDLTKQAQTQGQTIVDIQKTQSGLSADVADVKGNVSSLQDTANSLQATVKDNQGNISKLQDTASGLQATVKDNQGNISKLQGTANSLQSSITNNANNISNIKQTADRIQSTVSNMKVSSENLLPDTLDFAGWQQGGQGNMDSAQADNTLTNAWHAWGDNNSAWIGSPQAKPVFLRAGTQYTFSAVCWNNGTSIGNNFDDDDVELHFNNNDNSKAYNHQLTGKTNKDHIRYSVTFTVDTDGLYWGFKIVDMSGFIGGSLWSAEYMLVEGNVAVAYQPSSTAMATDISTVQQTVNGLESTVQNNKGDISQVKQTATSLQSTITKQIGTYLPNGDFADTDISKYWAPWASNNFDEVSVLPTDVPTMPINYMRIHCNANEEKTSIGTKDFIPVNINENLEIKAWSWLGAEKTGPAFQMFVHCFDSNNQEVNCFNGYFKYDKLNEWEKTDVTWETDAWGNSNIVSIKIELVVFSNGVDASGCVSGLEVVNGTSGIASQFTQSIDSITSKIEDADGDISTLKQTATSLTTRIGNATGDISSLKQRADSMETNISNNQNDISSLKQTASSLQSNIQSKADISQVTQLSNTFQTVVQTIGAIFPNGNFNDSNIQTYWLPWDVTTDYTNITYDSHHPDGFTGSLCLHDTAGGTTKAITKEYIPVVPGQDVTLSVWSAVDWSGNSPDSKIYIHFYDKDKNEVSSANAELQHDSSMNWYHNTWTWGTFNNNYYARIEVYTHSDVEARTYVTGFDIQSGNGATLSSKISQLSNDINLKVQKGDLISQVNIEAGKTLIQSKNLYLDASTVTFSGNAFIPSAAITDLSADKITAGTLNAGNVNIINLDVNKLVGDTTEFVRSGWTNAYGSHVQIDGGGMAVSYGDWYTKFDTNGVSFKNGSEVLGGITHVGMQTAPGWYNGLAINAGGDAEFLSIGAQDYGNDSQNPVPAKLLWMRSFDENNRYGYQPGWNVLDNLWANQVGMSSIQYGDWNIHFETASGDNGFTALELLSGIGNGFYWGSDGSFGYVTNHNSLHNVNGSQIVTSIDRNGGTCESWHTVQ